MGEAGCVENWGVRSWDWESESVNVWDRSVDGLVVLRGISLMLLGTGVGRGRGVDGRVRGVRGVGVGG